MRFDKATIDIRPRSAFEMVDLALAFYRHHLGLLAKINLILALPALALGTAIAFSLRDPIVAFLGFWMLLPLSSGGVIIAASRRVFGTPLTVKSALGIYRPLAAAHFFGRLTHRILWVPLLPLGLVFGEILRLKWSFSPMILLLERLEGRQLSLRRRGLHRRGGASAFGFDLAVLTSSCWLIGALLFIADLVLSDLLSVWEFGGLFTALGSNPWGTVIVLITVILVSPVIDLAWFFYYLDARIRKEGWDLELGFRSIARRLSSNKQEAA